jgi:nucleolar protein 12
MLAKAKVEAEAQAKAKAAQAKAAKAAAKAAANSDDDEDEDKEEGSGSDEDLVHEALKSPSARRARENKGQTSKYVPPDETAADRDRRTLFIGNLPISATEKAGTAALKRHLLSFATTAKIESVRFRSVAFSTPTSGADPTGEKKADADEEKEASRREAREKERAATWKASQAGSSVGGRGNRRGDDEVTDKSKSFLDKKGKRKVAFIKKDFHSEADSCNAYVVFAHPHPDRPKNVAPILDPYEAAATIATAANGTEVLGRKIRVDTVRLPSAIGLASAQNNLGKRDAWLPSGTDPKCSLFVGGLDYAAKDDDVRAFFESLVVAERGSPESGSWVTGVRIVRDRDSQMGKGFGYVHFVDRESVDELISMPSAKLKFAKKPLRVQACKTLPPAAKRAATAAKDAKDGKADAKGVKKERAPKRTAPTAMPKGDPSLGERLKDLSKDERKAAKHADATRLARRMAKKANKVANAHKETGAVKLAATKAEKGQRAKKVKAKKGRVRSAHALTKMKGKRE